MKKGGKSGALYAEVAPVASGAHTNVILGQFSDEMVKVDENQKLSFV